MNTLHVHPVGIRTAQAIGLTGSAILLGAGLTMNFIIVPTLLKAPAPILIQQWKKTFVNARAVLPFLAVVNASANIYLYTRSAYTLPAYLFAGIFSVGIIPYTFAFMFSTNKKLLAMAESVEMKGEGNGATNLAIENAHALVDQWGVLQLGRTGMGAVSVALSVWSIFF